MFAVSNAKKGFDDSILYYLKILLTKVGGNHIDRAHVSHLRPRSRISLLVDPVFPLIVIAGESYFYQNQCLENTFEAMSHTFPFANLKLSPLNNPLYPLPSFQTQSFLTKKGFPSNLSTTFF